MQKNQADKPGQVIQPAHIAHDDDIRAFSAKHAPSVTGRVLQDGARIWQLIAGFVLIIIIFIADTVTDLEIAAAVFYVAVVLLSVRLLQRSAVIWTMLLCVVLTVVSYFLTLSGSPESGIVNAGISIAAIGVTTWLALQIRAAQQAVEDARKQMEQMARVMTLGELTTSIAHEVNQPLAAVTTSAAACKRWLVMEPPNLEKAKQAVERISKDAARAAEVVGRVRALVQRQPSAREVVQLNSVIADVVALVRGDLERAKITLRLDLDEDLPVIVVDKIEIEQVLLNLIGNAVDAVRSAVSVPVQTGLSEVSVTSRREPDGGVRIAVADTGNGVPAERLKTMFDAFYTTKTGGIGIGLAISRSIIEAHQGAIRAYPRNPHGLVVEFTLKKNEGAA